MQLPPIPAEAIAFDLLRHGNVHDLLAEADAAMSTNKAARKAQRH